MRISKVKIVNFCQHEKREDDFGPGVVGIVGSNGAGKSNYLNAIQRAFTGKSGNEGKKEEDLKWGADKGSLEVRFTVGTTEGIIKRDLKTTRCSLKFGDKEFKSAAEIDGVIYDILGVSPKMLSELMFVPQFRIHEILSQTPSERAKSFQVLFGTENAEFIRDVLHEEINRTVVESKAEAITQLEAQLKVNVEEPLKKSYEAREIRKREVIDDLRRAGLELIIANYEAYHRHKAAYDVAVIKLNDESAIHDSLQALVDANQAVVKELEQALADTQQEVDAARERLNSNQERIRAHEYRERLKLTVYACEQVLKRVPPAMPALTKQEVEYLRLKYYAAEADWRASDKVSKLDPNLAKCPTCKQPITAEHIAFHKRSADAMTAALGEMKTRLDEAQRAWDEYIINDARYQSDRKAALTTLERDKKLLDQTTEVHLITPEQIKADEEMVNLFSDFQRSKVGAEKELSSNTVELAESTTQMEAYRARVAEEQAAMGQPTPEEHYKKAKDELEKSGKSVLALAEINGAVTNLENQRDSLTKQINDLKEQEKKNLPLLKWKAMCERGRMILHRDNLPNMVAQKYLDAINVKLAQYMEVFDVPFTATIGKDLGIECLFSGNNTTSVGRLSGGQKVMLGVAFRFAVHEMFAANLGLLALDEPTLALDDDHVECVSSLLEKVKSYSKTAGLQLIVVTHEQRLTGVFDSVIRV